MTAGAMTRILICLFTAGFVGALMVDPRDTLTDTLAKGIGMLAMLLLALAVAVRSRRQEAARAALDHGD
jgi:DMSO/TMAO reductase YedYZ heme-binding membrane subunit